MLHTEVQPLTLVYIIYTEKVTLSYILYWKKILLWHAHLRTLNPFLNPWNKVNEQYYGRTSSITGIQQQSASNPNILITGPLKYLNARFPYPFIYLNLWNSHPSIYLKPEKGTRFGRSFPVSAILESTPTPPPEGCNTSKKMSESL